MHMSVGGQRGSKKVLDSLTLKLQAVVSYPWVLRTKRGSFGGAASALTAKPSLNPLIEYS